MRSLVLIALLIFAIYVYQKKTPKKQKGGSKKGLFIGFLVVVVVVIVVVVVVVLSEEETTPTTTTSCASKKTEGECTGSCAWDSEENKCKNKAIVSCDSKKTEGECTGSCAWDSEENKCKNKTEPGPGDNSQTPSFQDIVGGGQNGDIKINTRCWSDKVAGNTDESNTREGYFDNILLNGSSAEEWCKKEYHKQSEGIPKPTTNNGQSPQCGENGEICTPKTCCIMKKTCGSLREGDPASFNCPAGNVSNVETWDTELDSKDKSGFMKEYHEKCCRPICGQVGEQVRESDCCILNPGYVSARGKGFDKDYQFRFFGKGGSSRFAHIGGRGWYGGDPQSTGKFCSKGHNFTTGGGKNGEEIGYCAPSCGVTASANHMFKREGQPTQECVPGGKALQSNRPNDKNDHKRAGAGWGKDMDKFIYHDSDGKRETDKNDTCPRGNCLLVTGEKALCGPCCDVFRETVSKDTSLPPWGGS